MPLSRQDHPVKLTFTEVCGLGGSGAYGGNMTRCWGISQLGQGCSR